MVSKTSKGLLMCSTPEHGGESPSRDSDSLYDSESASPVPFLCTQDGAEGETDVVWNFYTPKSGRAAHLHLKNTTPVSSKSKKSIRTKLIDKPQPKRRNIRNTQKNTQLFQDLIELNQNLHELIPKKPPNCTEKQHSGSEDDVFGISPDCSPKGNRRLSSNCLRRNVLSSNFNKPENENVLESDDSMNECLIKASQIVEDIVYDDKPSLPKRPCYELNQKSRMDKSICKPKINHDSMDAILSNIKLESPQLNKVKKIESPNLKDDSFDSMFGNLNESILDQLTQMPVKTDISSKDNDWKVEELVFNDGSPMSKSFVRHNSMPESPSIINANKPSTSGMVFGKYNSMPYEKHAGNRTAPGDSPIRCTPDEIKKKHQLAREKLLAKRLLPFTSNSDITKKNETNTVPPSLRHTTKTQNSVQHATKTQNNVQHVTKTQDCVQNSVKSPNKLAISPKSKNAKFIPKVPISCRTSPQNKLKENATKPTDLKSLLEQKRQEALLRLRRRQQNK